MDLFSCNTKTINLPNATLFYDPYFLSKASANKYLKNIYNETPWQQDEITVFGKTYKQPRLTALMGDEGVSYTYSNITMKAISYTQSVLRIKSKIETATGYEFNSLLLNLYRNGNDSNGWHADNESLLGLNPVIASVSFGVERLFHFKHKTIKTERHKLKLTHGSLLIMSGEMQHYWLHQIAKTKKNIGPRINLTFRSILL